MNKNKVKLLLTGSLLAIGAGAFAGDTAIDYASTASLSQSFQIADARQGVAVDESHFYAVDNTEISKHDKQTGALVKQWTAPDSWAPIHFDSGAVIDGKLYVAHSNYHQSPMTSSVEVWDAETLEHIPALSHSFGINRGSLTWIDRAPDGKWWGCFANYDRVFDGKLYGGKKNTQIVRFGENWKIEEAFLLPQAILDRFDNMSNSGGSWGPDGRLYITGHDRGELYVLEEPAGGSVMHWAKTVKIDGIEGQGIAWDRSAQIPTLYGIIRGEDETEHKVTVNTVPQ